MTWEPHGISFPAKAGVPAHDRTLRNVGFPLSLCDYLQPRSSFQLLQPAEPSAEPALKAGPGPMDALKIVNQSQGSA